MTKLKRNPTFTTGCGPLGPYHENRLNDLCPMSLVALGFREAVMRAAGWDAGNRSVKAAGRNCWNDDDYNAASREYERLLQSGCKGCYLENKGCPIP